MGLICERCGGPNRIKANRYCTPCKHVVLREQREAGYFQSTYAPRVFNDERGRKGMRDPRVLGGVPH